MTITSLQELRKQATPSVELKRIKHNWLNLIPWDARGTDNDAAQSPKEQAMAVCACFSLDYTYFAAYNGSRIIPSSLYTQAFRQGNATKLSGQGTGTNPSTVTAPPLFLPSFVHSIPFHPIRLSMPCQKTRLSGSSIPFTSTAAPHNTTSSNMLYWLHLPSNLSSLSFVMLREHIDHDRSGCHNRDTKNKSAGAILLTPPPTQPFEGQISTRQHRPAMYPPPGSRPLGQEPLPRSIWALIQQVRVAGLQRPSALILSLRTITHQPAPKMLPAAAFLPSRVSSEPESPTKQLGSDEIDGGGTGRSNKAIKTLLNSWQASSCSSADRLDFPRSMSLVSRQRIISNTYCGQNHVKRNDAKDSVLLVKHKRTGTPHGPPNCLSRRSLHDWRIHCEHRHTYEWVRNAIAINVHPSIIYERDLKDQYRLHIFKPKTSDG
ncbi:uncharacterized protein CLUP02_10548 [Colletotrichum lupini]|uniref:Uncharacterized protein n=1 Tax=Colletotrichum lupini TaxID=145971 RepID=A0A9Q8SYN1_9PEZI|nr:uncharacterized protein CLUP02_10548 [Colletotrichum lupini]UQC85052.1 hypothetical protein CLUP02_10548 [Colletotrichum lupini]